MDIRSTGSPITDLLIITRAQFLKDEMKINTNCKFSNGWLRNFKKRYKLVSRRGGSKLIRENDCELVTIKSFLVRVNKKINSNQYSSILNLDESGVYYDSKISHTLDVKGTKRVEIRTTGREKQRATTLMGIDKLKKIHMKPLIIFKGKTNKCIEKIPESDKYILAYQENAWCNEDIFIEFISQLPINTKILLIYDNFSAHVTDKVKKFMKETYPLIDIILLPPNTTPILQPLDVGINKPFKTFIRNQYIDWLTKNYQNNSILEVEINERKKLLVDWILNSWNKITDRMIQKSFDICGYGNTKNIEPMWKEYFKIEYFKIEY
jgi:hypothetical protein